MESSLLQKYLPEFVLDAGETVAPVDVNQWAAGCVVKDDAYDNELKGSITQNLANPSCYLQSTVRAGNASTITAGGEAIGNTVTTVGPVPIAGKVDTLLVGGRWFYCLLYMYAFPASDADALVVHYLKLLVATDTGAIEQGVFGLAGNALSPAVVSAPRMQFADRSMQRPLVFLAKDSHSPLPRPGRYWKSGAQGQSQQCSPGAKWAPASAGPLSNALMQFKGRLSPAQSAQTPTEQPWWQSTVLVDVDRIFQRFIDCS
ncbi:hypothetical protein WJX74_010087 [Apatococcus lobatus]|uniref:Uncharacterized protein n=1 Tax=Apatococcus lobatus TaxID=904363 RepID=A0AAW1PR49_9CHLO